MDHKLKDKTVCIAGLGYVGLPLALAFSGHLTTIGFDVDAGKIRELSGANDNPGIAFTDNPEEIRSADFIIIAVPTPVTKSKDPDLSYIESAAATIGTHLKRGATVVLESTVYPGVTEEVLKPILEHESGLNCGTDFKIGYSPERINPGDDEHSLERITKIVSGMDRKTTEALSSLYGMITTVYEARDIRTAEAAKVIENIQRDLNIALVNELSLIFGKMGLSTDFFTKNRVKTALRVGFRLFLRPKAQQKRVTVFDQTFVKSLRVRNALQVGLKFLVNILLMTSHAPPRFLRPKAQPKGGYSF
jgi:UDPglucose 6-dehydrogenase/UDP-N-acetyl-D-galactosamine dehydrogenase